ncbi:MAG: DNA polymerase III subunit [Deltaproteobacteria bacterium]|nr:DNA polymerase III subunit [Deltaproteobacteria bacterium]
MRFSEILGHTKELNILKGAITGGRVAHAYLFAGPDGIGKRQAAFALATALNCREFREDACGQCPDCEKAGRSVHPNINEVWPTIKAKGRTKDTEDGADEPREALEKAERPEDGLIRIPQIREILGFLKLRIDHGRKVVIIDAADRLMSAAANAFLKTLEEPPDASVIILVTAHPGLLPATVLSRCQRINFSPLQDSTVAAYLTAGQGVGRAEAIEAAGLSQGSISRAISLACGGAVERRGSVLERLGAVPMGDAFKAMQMAEELAKMDGLEEALEFIKGWYRQTATENEIAEGQSGNGAFRRIWTSYRAVDEALYDITPPRYANRQITMEAMMLKIAGLAR